MRSNMKICRDIRSLNRFSRIPFCSRFQILHQDSRFQLGFQTICVGFQLVSGPPIDASNLVKAYYGETQRSITNNLEKAIEAIKDGNINVDLKGAEDKLAEAHFDSERFQDGQNRLVMIRENVVSSIRMKNFDMARRDAGRLLHTLQDFYSHSNWVENGNSDIYRVLGRKNQRPYPVAPVSLQTCTDCEEDGMAVLGRIIGFVRQTDSAKNFYSCPDNFHGFLKQSRILTSGYYTGTAKNVWISYYFQSLERCWKYHISI